MRDQRWIDKVANAPRRTMSESNQLEVLNGGAYVEVQHLDGTKEKLFVRKVSLKTLPLYASAFGTEGKEALFYAGNGHSEEWLENLTLESCEALIQEGRRLNFPPLERFRDRQRQALKALGIADETEAAVERAVQEQIRAVAATSQQS